MPTSVMSKIETITDQHISTLLGGQGLQVVLMSSPWDGNGIIMLNILQGVASQHREIGFYHADYEASPRLGRLFNLLSPPGILFLKDGELVNRVTKPMSAGSLQDLINNLTR